MSKRILLVLVALLAGAGCVTNGPQALTCKSDSSGNHLSWSAVENATSYQVYRVEPGFNATIENATLVANTTATTWTDTNVTAGGTYQYAITATLSNGEQKTQSFPSPVCAVTSVPVFPSVLVAGLALVGGIGVVLLVRRRK